MSLWHQIWFQSLHTGQALLYRHSWPIFGPLGPFWWPQKGNFMSKLIPFVAPNSHKSSLLSPEKIIIWPKITRFGPKCQMMLHLGGHQKCSAFWTLYMEFRPFEGFQMDLFVHKMAFWGHLKWAPMVQKWVMLHNKYHVPTSGHFGPSDDLFRGQKVGFVTIGGYKGGQFAHKIALFGPPKGPQ